MVFSSHAQLIFGIICLNNAFWMALCLLLIGAYYLWTLFGQFPSMFFIFVFLILMNLHALCWPFSLGWSKYIPFLFLKKTLFKIGFMEVAVNLTKWIFMRLIWDTQVLKVQGNKCKFCELSKYITQIVVFLFLICNECKTI